MSKIYKRGGFTLAELLIVIAIMAILIAIAIPVFSAQMENARHAVDDSAERSAMSMAEAHYLLCHAQDERVTNSSPLKITFKSDKDNNMTIDTCSLGSDSSGKATTTCVTSTTSTVSGDETVVTSKCTDDTAAGPSDGGNGAGYELSCEVKPGGFVSAKWSKPSTGSP